MGTTIISVVCIFLLVIHEAQGLRGRAKELIAIQIVQ